MLHTTIIKDFSRVDRLNKLLNNTLTAVADTRKAIKTAEKNGDSVDKLNRQLNRLLNKAVDIRTEISVCNSNSDRGELVKVTTDSDNSGGKINNYSHLVKSFLYEKLFADNGLIDSATDFSVSTFGADIVQACITIAISVCNKCFNATGDKSYLKLLSDIINDKDIGHDCRTAVYLSLVNDLQTVHIDSGENINTCKLSICDLVLVEKHCTKVIVNGGQPTVTYTEKTVLQRAFRCCRSEIHNNHDRATYKFVNFEKTFIDSDGDSHTIYDRYCHGFNDGDSNSTDGDKFDSFVEQLKLTDVQRAILSCRYAGLSYADIATRQGCSKSTVATHMNRIKASALSGMLFGTITDKDTAIKFLEKYLQQLKRNPTENSKEIGIIACTIADLKKM